MFSGTVKIGDVSDFIAPSQDCIVSLGNGKAALSNLGGQEEEVGLVRPSRIRATAPGLAQESATPVTISLNDCLACSGCVTSAETVLLEAQSTDALMKRLTDSKAIVVISLSPQSVCSLAVAVGISDARILERRLAAAFRSLGAHTVVSTSPARDIVLADVAAEALDRWRHKKDKSKLPVLASACPGWVCYAEKTHGSWILPYMSRTRSPQALAAAFIKGWWAEQRGLKASDIFHCSVMPCFDKKLEASRDDFASNGIPETDCVLATTEVAELMKAQGIDLSKPVVGEERALDDVIPFDRAMEGDGVGSAATRSAGWIGARLAGSGSYMEAVLRAVAGTIPGAYVPAPGKLVTVAGRNPDVQEAYVEVDGKPVFRCAAIYGFRNIQGLVRKMKLGKCPYDYVEVMACPSGCLNGGGQLRPRPGQSMAELVQALEEGYLRLRDTAPANLEESEALQTFVSSTTGLQNNIFDSWHEVRPQLLSLVHTQYHAREKSVASALRDW